MLSQAFDSVVRSWPFWSVRINRNAKLWIRLLISDTQQEYEKHIHFATKVEKVRNWKNIQWTLLHKHLWIQNKSPPSAGRSKPLCPPHRHRWSPLGHFWPPPFTQTIRDHQGGDSVGFVYLCVFHEKRHTQTHISALLPVIVIWLRRRHSGKRHRGIVFVSVRVCLMCARVYVCVRAMLWHFASSTPGLSCVPVTPILGPATWEVWMISKRVRSDLVSIQKSQN